MIQALKQSDDRVQEYRGQVQALLREKPDVEQLSLGVQRIAGATADDPSIIVGVRDMWHTFRLMRQHHRDGRGIFHAWRQWTQFVRQHRAHKKMTRQLQRTKIMNMLTQAREAADKHDMHGVYKVVRRLARKIPKKTLQLRRDGLMRTPGEELTWMMQVFGERFGGQPSHSHPSQVPLCAVHSRC